MAKENQEEVIVDVEQAVSRSEQWVVENQKSLSIIAGVAVLLVLSYFAYNNFIQQPQEEEAHTNMWEAERAFGQDSMNLALNGNPVTGALGFLDIIDEYSMTKSANLAHYYAGVCYLRLGDNESAINYLEDFDCNDVMVCAVALGATGDAYMELGQVDRAIEYYQSAADHNENDLTAPIYLMKAGRAYEAAFESGGSASDMQNAAKMYQRIKDNYPDSNEGRSIDKFIARAEAKSKG